MDLKTLTSQLSLRSRLWLLNGGVAAGLLLLSLQAWHASSVQERAQARQVELANALHQNKQADMLHDALRSDVLASLLVGQVEALTAADALHQVEGDVQILSDALLALSRVDLPEGLATQVARNREAALAYGKAAVAVVRSAATHREDAMAALPAFEARFQNLLEELDNQGRALELTLHSAQAEAAQDADVARRSLLWACVLAIGLTTSFVALVTASLRRRLRSLGEVAQAIAHGDLARRTGSASADELGDLGRAIDRMATSLSDMIHTMRRDAERAVFSKNLAEALDMADREQQVAAVAARAMAEVSPRHAMELLISDSSRAQMERAAEHPLLGAPGCGVGSPYDCVAVRRGHVVSTADSDALNACAQLRGRACGRAAAVCVPVSFMGRAIGVLHAAGPVDAPLSAEQAQHLATLGAQIGVRIGTVRAFEKTQIQAATDGLTGLPNRRTLEQRMRALAASNADFVVVMCDLDHFKLLNDTHGHTAGDNALRLFSDVLRHSLRESDSVGRWGGEEFAFVLDNSNAQAADELVERLRKSLAATLQLGKAPRFTASFGIADTSMSRRPEMLVQLADVALYQAKASGRDRACIADPSAFGDGLPVRHTEVSGRGIDVDAALHDDA